MKQWGKPALLSGSRQGWFVWLVFALMACQSSRQSPLFELMPPEKTGISFANTITESDTFNVLRFEYIYNGGGVGIGDVNNDGLADIYFSGNMVSSKLYLNKGHFQFEDITLPAGVATRAWATGVSMVDINQDGWLDIHVCTIHPDAKQSSPNLVFLNNGPNAQGIPTFTESAAQLGLADTGYSTQAAFFDYDRDGDLDMYLLTNALEGYNRNTARAPLKNGEGRSTDRLYRNDLSGGQGKFTNVSREAGILQEGWGLGVAIGDFNRDGWPDVYCANDFLSNDLLWINNHDGTFTNRIAQYLKHQSHNSMGIDIADINNDGLSDFAVMDMMPEQNLRQKTMFPTVNYDRYQVNLQMGYQTQYVRNVLQLNRGSVPGGHPRFSEIGQLAGVHATDWSWSPLFADYDNDGYKDLLVTNGYHKDLTDLDYITYRKEMSQFGNQESVMKNLTKEIDRMQGVKVPNYLYHNNGDLTFTNLAPQWGLEQPSYSNGAAYADLDNDGDLDLVVNNLNDPAFVYQNRAELRKDDKGRLLNHFLRIQLTGSEQNRQGLGARIELRYGGQRQTHEHSVVRGYKSTVESAIHFGLGSRTEVDTVCVTWPDGKSQLLTQVPAGQPLRIDYRNAVDPLPASEPLPQPLFREVSQQCNIHFKHEESDYVDFKIQPLLPHKFSQEGPGLAVGDMDGNGLEDFYVGNSVRNGGALFFQQAGGTFRRETFEAEQKFEEDEGTLLFDADNDGDLDLYVVSGSTEYRSGSANYQDRLYRNDGKGHYRLDSLALPATTASGSCVVAADYDRDGDLDLFVGGRVVPANYPMPAQSYLLNNEKGRFRDATPEVNQALAGLGLVTSALWTDFDGDGWTDLVVVGEWMPITFFKNNLGKFVAWDANEGKISQSAPSSDASLLHSSGWWNSLTAGDFDNDGDVDYLAGNLGLNSRYKASVKEPVRTVAKDFDGNGSLDPLLCYYLLGEDGQRHLYPTHPRDLMNDQMVGMRKKFHYYADYGKATFQDLFTEKELEGSYELKSETFRTSYLENQGGGRFVLKPLPVETQFAPVYGMIADDFNHDGNLDVLMAGNSYANEVLAGMYDASIGTYLQGNGKGGFSAVPLARSGFLVDGDAKGMAELHTQSGESLVLVACNSDSLKVFAVASSADKKDALVPTGSMDAYAVMTLKNGRKRKQELYYGSTYLSQSSRRLKVPGDAQSVVIYDFKGRGRSLAPVASANAAPTLKKAGRTGAPVAIHR